MLDRANTENFIPDFKRASDLALRHTLEFDGDVDVYLDLLTLQARIAGRSPAFEGIRLVKERIR